MHRTFSVHCGLELQSIGQAWPGVVPCLRPVSVVGTQALHKPVLQGEPGEGSGRSGENRARRGAPITQSVLAL